MKHATLRQLKVFEAVARLLSFSRAAEINPKFAALAREN